MSLALTVFVWTLTRRRIKQDGNRARWIGPSLWLLFTVYEAYMVSHRGQPDVAASAVDDGEIDVGRLAGNSAMTRSA